MIPLTVPEVRRLLWRLIWSTGADAEDVLAWSRWHHQARAKRAHIQRRATRSP